MILVTTGGAILRPFNRLIKKMDEMALNLNEKVIIQRGVSRYIPQNCSYFDFVPRTTLEDYFQQSRLVISHAGIGSIISCRKFGPPLIIIPRRKKYGEHYSDHQMEIIKAIQQKGREGIWAVEDVDQIADVLKEIPAGKIYLPEHKGRVAIINTIKGFIQNEIGLSFSSK